MPKHKLLHFISTLGIGGAQILVKDYALLTDKSKFDVVILCVERKNTFLENVLEDAGIRVIYASDYLPFKNFFLKNILAHRILLKTGLLKLIVRHFIQKESPDILHFHLPNNAYIKFANPPQKCVLVHTIHSQPEKYWCTKKTYDRNDFKALNYLVHSRGTQLIALNDHARNVANQLFNVKNTIILNNAINFDKFDISESKNEIRASLGIDRNCYLVGNVGRFWAVKNHTLIVKAFAELSKAKNDVHLLLVGDGDLRPQIESEIESLGIKDKVTILNARNDVPRILKALDVFIFPSLYEGLGIVLIEAQKMGIPCVISNAIPQEAVISNLVHRMGENATPSDYAKALNNAHVDRIEYHDLEKWNMKIVIKQLENIYIQNLRQKGLYDY
ncbi:glycosyltransferase [Candidatus Saccharibacteria bacterium]|nr:glycosyltransferase [Candidatus Saccharibacteria bacterium]